MTAWQAVEKGVDARPLVSLGATITRLAPALLFLIFFLSGASALIYEVVWTRALALVFGVTIHAVSVVLAAFMGGLAVGSYLAGPRADRARRPLRSYALVELGIGLSGALSLLVLERLPALYILLFDRFDGAMGPVTVVRFLGASLVVLLPAALMGATLPFMTRASLIYVPRLAENLSLLYAVNTAGAALGVALVGFVLIALIGMQGAVNLAAGVNLVAALLALALERLSGPVSRPAETAAGQAPPSAAATSASSILPPTLRRAVVVGFGLSGLCALAYEVVWFRVLALLLNATTYAFSTMLFVFLVGLAVGSAVVRPLLARPWRWGAVFAGLQLLVGLQTVLAEYLVGGVPGAVDRLLGASGLTQLLGQTFFPMLVAASLVLLPLTLLQGMTFPVAARALAPELGQAGAVVGRLNAANTLGAIVGSLVAGFWLVPGLGSQGSLTLLGLVNLSLAALLFWLALPQSGLARRAVPLLLLALVPLARAPDMLGDVLRGVFPTHQVLWHEEGIEQTVSVQIDDDQATAMYLNSAISSRDRPSVVEYHRFIGSLGVLLHPDPREALVIGMGIGTTPGAISRYRPTHLDLVELSPSVVRAAAFFRPVNADVLNQPNVSLLVDDGRNHLLLTRKRYDLIAADVIRPEHAGSGNLYAREFFQLALRALNEDGLMVQWAGSEARHQELITRTFVSVFPYVTVWRDGGLLVGSRAPQDLRPESLQQRLDRPAARELAASVGLTSAAELLRSYSGDGPAVVARLGPGPLLSDDRPLTEFFLFQR